MLMSVQLCYRDGTTKVFNVETEKLYPRVATKLKDTWVNYHKNNKPVITMTKDDMQQLERAQDKFEGLWSGDPIKILQN